MEDENSSILKDNSLISQPNQVIQQVEQTIPPSPPPLPLPPSPQINILFNMQNSNSSILTDNLLIIQPTLAPSFPPLFLPLPAPLPPSPPPPLQPPPLPPVNQEALLPTPRIPKHYILYERPGTYKLPRRLLKEVANHRFKIYDKDEPDDLYDPYDFDFDEYTNKILYDNPEFARYLIHKDIRFDDIHMWVTSEEDNASTEEESDDDYLEEVYDSETNADDYLNEIPEAEVFENNDKNQNYDFNKEKKKYESKDPKKDLQNIMQL
jgi:hypothetical protein